MHAHTICSVAVQKTYIVKWLQQESHLTGKEMKIQSIPLMLNVSILIQGQVCRLVYFRTSPSAPQRLTLPFQLRGSVIELDNAPSSFCLTSAHNQTTYH